MKYLIIAGETSGDVHGAGLASAIISLDPEAEIRYFGGDSMQNAVGHSPLVHISRMAYMGFGDVLRHLPDVRRNLATALDTLQEFRPQGVILIDYPSFNLRVAARAYELGIPVFYYIPPKVWAWKEHRLKALRRYITRIYSILPFEEPYYRAHGMADVHYCGNPTVDQVHAANCDSPHPLSGGVPTVAIVPGSRVGEIKRNLHPMLRALTMLGVPVRAVIAGAPSLPQELYDTVISEVELPAGTSLDLDFGHTLRIMHSADAALVTSGTATLECALARTPQVAVYRGNGSRLTYAIMSRWLKIPYVTLPNLIAGEGVIPELLMHRCTPEAMALQLKPLLSPSPVREAQLRGYEKIASILGQRDPATTAAASITSLLLK